MKIKILLLSLAAVTVLGSCGSNGVSTVKRIPTDSRNSHYYSNAEPLQREQFIKLPTGSIKPGGWILKQLELQKDGLNGHLSEISAWLQKENNAWLEAGGEWGWEEVPYWLRGYASLSYIFEDKDMLDETMVWIEAILASQLENGDFGPSSRSDEKIHDFWPNMIALWILQDYYEYSNDERIIPFMLKYCKFLAEFPEEGFLKSYWQNSRGGDNLWSVAWLYNRTGEDWLLALGDKLHRCTANWTRATQLPNWHNVNIAQSFREPATYYMFNGDSTYLKATYNVFSFVRRAFGQVPGGMFGADENARIGFFDPRQGTEICGFTEQMASDEILMLITGDPMWAENLEDVAFNSYPAAFTSDYRALRYITSPNQSISDSRNHSPGIDNRGPFMAMNPFSNRCCQHNHGYTWPFYNEFLVMATPDNGAAVALYNECSAKLTVGDGTQITLNEKTHYPFEEKVEFTLETPENVNFPLYLRVPSWCRKACIKKNGKLLSSSLEPGTYVRIEQEWKDGDKLTLELPMELTTREWVVNKNSVSVNYGPLTLSLKIGEEYRKIDTHSTAVQDAKWQEGADPEAWPAFDIYPTTTWNYALATDAKISIERTEWPADNNPFTLENVPLHFKAYGRVVPEWGIDQYGLTAVLPYEDAKKEDKLDEIELVPMGAARLRISAFPTCSAK